MMWYSLVGNSSSSHCCATRPCKPCWISWLWYLIWLAVLGFISLVYESPQHPVRFRSPWKPPISNTKLGTGRRPPTKTYLIQQILGIANGRHSHLVRWRHQMETFSALLAICAGNSPVPGEFPTQRPVTRSFDVYFDLRPNKWLSKQSWGWWFETLSCSLWRHRNRVIEAWIFVTTTIDNRECCLKPLLWLLSRDRRYWC